MSRFLAAILVVLGGCAVAPGTQVATPELGKAETLPRSGTWTDPVCGQMLDDTAPWKEDYAGIEYRFHARQCRDDFVSNPEAFLGNPRHPGYSRAMGPQLATDPVCGREIDAERALREYYQGQPVFFHADECRRWFLADPTTFIDAEGRPRDFTAR